MCVSHSSTWISNGTCCGFFSFCGQWLKARGVYSLYWYRWNCWPHLSQVINPINTTWSEIINRRNIFKFSSFFSGRFSFSTKLCKSLKNNANINLTYVHIVFNGIYKCMTSFCLHVAKNIRKDTMNALFCFHHFMCDILVL